MHLDATAMAALQSSKQPTNISAPTHKHNIISVDKDPFQGPSALIMIMCLQLNNSEVETSLYIASPTMS